MWARRRPAAGLRRCDLDGLLRRRGSGSIVQRKACRCHGLCCAVGSVVVAAGAVDAHKALGRRRHRRRPAPGALAEACALLPPGATAAAHLVAADVPARRRVRERLAGGALIADGTARDVIVVVVVIVILRRRGRRRGLWGTRHWREEDGCRRHNVNWAISFSRALPPSPVVDTPAVWPAFCTVFSLHTACLVALEKHRFFPRTVVSCRKSETALPGA